MARPPKQTVDYFSHDADASDGKTLTILENHFGAEGYMAWFKLLERLARVRNHIIDLRNHDSAEFLAAKMRLAPERFTQILDKMAELEAIDKELYTQKIIWCQNFVDRLKDVYDNRKQPLPLKPAISTIDNQVTVPSPIDNNHIFEDSITPIIPQSKVKETIVNKSKVKKEPLQEYIRRELTNEFPDLDIIEELKKFTLYWSEGKRKLQRPKTAFRNWLVNARKYKQEKQNGNIESIKSSGFQTKR